MLNPRLLLWDCGAGHFFFSGFSPHRAVDEFLFPVIPAQLVGTLMQKVRMAVKTVLSAISYSLWRR